MRLRRLLLGSLLLAAAGLIFQGLYIPAKAVLAQFLLKDAWQRTISGEEQSRPWPWADTWPLARLLQSRLGVDQVVLSGSSGRVLAFGPGHVSVSAKPGDPGNVVISGHRDTHFSWLASLQDGDRLELQLPDGRAIHYAVLRRQVHHKRELGLLDPHAFDGLRMITCYPFDATVPGGDQRFVVDAVRL